MSKILRLIVLIIVFIFSSGCYTDSAKTQSKSEAAVKSSFCGISTFGACRSDSDCRKGGCSAQLCQSKSESAKFTTCEYRECYNAAAYGLGCKCVQNKCQWAK